MSETDMVPTIVNLDGQMTKDLKALSLVHDTSTAEVIRRLLQEGIERETSAPEFLVRTVEAKERNDKIVEALLKKYHCV